MSVDAKNYQKLINIELERQLNLVRQITAEFSTLVDAVASKNQERDDLIAKIMEDAKTYLMGDKGSSHEFERALRERLGVGEERKDTDDKRRII